MTDAIYEYVRVQQQVMRGVFLTVTANHNNYR